SNFTRLALGQGHAVIVLDLLTYAGHESTLDDVKAHPLFTFVKGDVADREKVRGLLAEHRPNAIAHFAAETHVDRSIDDPAVFLRTNVMGSFELMEAARHEKRLPADFRFLLVSTDEVYGALGPTGAFQEDSPYAPNSPYSASKASADLLARAYHETFNFPVIITNCSNNYGPFQFPEKLIPLVLLNALEAKDLPIYGDGGQIRDWLYVEDHCEAILQVLQKGKAGRKYLIGGRAEKTNLQLLDVLLAILEELRPAALNPAMKAKGIARYQDLKKFVADRPGHDRRYAIDPSRTEAEIGWKPRYTFEAGLRTAVEWYLANRDWCERVQKNNYHRDRLGLAEGGEK
ncbi:MAG: dTDP-glucose 4,6-dehydratase, partial [bacterium]